MPIYEYGCPKCGHIFEKLMKMGASAPPCPECDCEEVEKKVSASGFILKGGGWYKDHYGLKGGKSSKSSSSSSSSSKSSSGESSSSPSSSSSSSGSKGSSK